MSNSSSDFLLTDASVLFAASKNRDYRARVIQRFNTFVQFIQEHGLATRKLLAEGESATPSTKLMRSDLTEEGFAVFRDAHGKWLKGHDKGKDIADVSILEKCLEELRGSIK